VHNTRDRERWRTPAPLPKLLVIIHLRHPHAQTLFGCQDPSTSAGVVHQSMCLDHIEIVHRMSVSSSGRMPTAFHTDRNRDYFRPCPRTAHAEYSIEILRYGCTGEATTEGTMMYIHRVSVWERHQAEGADVQYEKVLHQQRSEQPFHEGERAHRKLLLKSRNSHVCCQRKEKGRHMAD
jgi:hypothetical protein